MHEASMLLVCKRPNCRVGPSPPSIISVCTLMLTHTGVLPCGSTENLAWVDLGTPSSQLMKMMWRSYMRTHD